MRELRQRIRAAIVNQGFEFPFARVTVSGFHGRPTHSEELAVAVAILIATDQIRADPDRVVAGALGLDGTVRWGNIERLAALRERR